MWLIMISQTTKLLDFTAANTLKCPLRSCILPKNCVHDIAMFLTINKHFSNQYYCNDNVMIITLMNNLCVSVYMWIMNPMSQYYLNKLRLQVCSQVPTLVISDWKIVSKEYDKIYRGSNHRGNNVNRSNIIAKYVCIPYVSDEN
jgi:hypothetical protein